LRTIAIAIVLPAFFAMYSCNGGSTDNNATTDSTSVSTSDSTDGMMDSLPTKDTSHKGDQTAPVKKP